jgi:hypothetical protein
MKNSRANSVEGGENVISRFYNIFSDIKITNSLRILTFFTSYIYCMENLSDQVRVFELISKKT